ncbi:MAG: hypothetical protein ACRCZP_11715 [Phycicoccus sp.]
MPILAIPGVVEPPIVDPQAVGGLAEVTWTGIDGSVWSLLGGDGVVLLPGVRGMGMPDVTRFTSESPSVDGARWRGRRVPEREVFWPLLLQDPGTDVDMMLRDRAWWAALHPAGTGLWEVVHPNGSRRRLRCRFASADDVSERDPLRAGWWTFGVTLIAEDPFWAGDPVTRAWSPGAQTPFFGGTIGGAGPPLHISPGGTIATAAVDNPGDEPAYPVWTVTGPTTSVSVGVDGHVVTLGSAIPAGQIRVVDTHPSRLTVVDGAGVDRLSEATAVEFAAIPPGPGVVLSLAMTGSGQVAVEFTPRHHRAW